MTTIAEIQKQLTTLNFDAYIVTRNNLFLGQDILDNENKIFELTGFDGSAGNLIIFRDKAVLLVDGRYELQAQNQTNKNGHVIWEKSLMACPFFFGKNSLYIFFFLCYNK